MTKEIPILHTIARQEQIHTKEEHSNYLKDTNPVIVMGGTFYDSAKNRLALRFIEQNGRKVLEHLANRLANAAPWRNRPPGSANHGALERGTTTGRRVPRHAFARRKQTRRIANVATSFRQSARSRTHHRCRPANVQMSPNQL